jgi:hypothetical protein
LLLDKLHDKPTTTAVFIYFVFDDIKKTANLILNTKKIKNFLFSLIAMVMYSNISYSQDASKIDVDLNWQTILKNNIELLDLIIKSNVDISDKTIVYSDEFYNKIGIDKKVALTLVEESKLAAGKLNAVYFKNAELCKNCSFETDDKWSLFVEKIGLFRNDKNAYQSFLNTVGYNIRIQSGCNNWRFCMCGSSCIITCEVPPVFAGCLLMCGAEFCN